MCPFCRDDLGQQDASPCLRCGVQLHTECVEEVSMCPVMGCGGTYKVVRKIRRRALRATPAAEPSWGGRKGVVAAFVIPAVILIGVGVFGNDTKAERKHARRQQQRAAKRVTRTVLEVRDQRPLLLSQFRLSVTMTTPGRIRISHQRARRGKSLHLILPLGTVLEGTRRERGARVPFRLVLRKDLNHQTNRGSLEVEALVLKGGLLSTHYHKNQRLEVFRVPAGAEERLAVRVLTAIEDGAPTAAQNAVQATLLIALDDGTRQEVVGSLPARQQEVALQGAQELFKSLLPKLGRRKRRALRGFIPLRKIEEYLRMDRAKLSRYDAFEPLRAAPVNFGLELEAVAHHFAAARLLPTQALSLHTLHTRLGSPATLRLADVFQRLRRAQTLFERLLLIEHIRKLQPLLGRGLAIVHIEDGLLRTPAARGAAAQGLASWKVVAGRGFMTRNAGTAQTFGSVIEAEVNARAELLRKLESDAGGVDRRAGRALELLAAHAPHHPALERLIHQAAGSTSQLARAAARAEVWCARASVERDARHLAPLASQPGDARQAAIGEAARVLRPKQRELLWHALIEKERSYSDLETAFVGLAERDQLNVEDLAAWCAIAAAEPSHAALLLATVGDEQIRDATQRIKSLDPRGWRGLAAFRVARASDPKDETRRLLENARGSEARLAVLDALVAREPLAGTRFATSQSSQENVDWRKRAVELSLKHVPTGARLRMILRRALRDRSLEVRRAAIPGLKALRSDPSFLYSVCTSRQPDLARAAFFELCAVDPNAALRAATLWTRSRDLADPKLALSVAREILPTRPSLARQILRSLLRNTRAPELRAEAKRLLE